DTFTYLNLLDNGLQGYATDTPGGWAGLGQTDSGRGGAGLFGTIHSYDDLLKLQELAAAAARPPSPNPNFTPAAQRDFTVRLLWSVTATYADANHEPRVTMRGSSRIAARPGETVRLQATATDPDGNAVSVRWWQWKDVGTYPGKVTFADSAALITS